jgi:hypothetical protein
MCDPISIGAAALTMGGGLVSSMGQAKQQRARQHVLAQERQRQAGYERQSAAQFDQSLPAASRQSDEARRTEAEARRTQEDSAVVNGGQIIKQPAGQAPQEVQSAYGEAMRRALASGISRVQRGARLGAYGDSQADLSADLARAAQWQSIFGGNAQRSAAVVPSELEAANSKGSGLMMLGNVMGLAGRGLGGFGASGGWDNLFGGGASNFGPTGATFAQELAGGVRPI